MHDLFMFILMFVIKHLKYICAWCACFPQKMVLMMLLYVRAQSKTWNGMVKIRCPSFALLHTVFSYIKHCALFLFTRMVQPVFVCLASFGKSKQRLRRPVRKSLRQVQIEKNAKILQKADSAIDSWKSFCDAQYSGAAKPKLWPNRTFFSNFLFAILVLSCSFSFCLALTSPDRQLLPSAHEVR